jgi:hypothetical protein
MRVGNTSHIDSNPLVEGKLSGNFVTWAGQMAEHGIPNNLMQNFDLVVTTSLLETFG